MATSTTARRGEMGEMTEAAFLAKVEAGIFYDRLDAFMPPELYGPPTEAELAAARAARQRAKAARATTATTSTRTRANGTVVRRRRPRR
jgi:hypothetical protein